MNDVTNIKIDPSKFQFAHKENIHDKKLETKPIGYFHDAWRRFRKNKASVVATVIIIFLLLFSFLVPIFCSNAYTRSTNDTERLKYQKLLPKVEWLSFMGVNGCKDTKINEAAYNQYRAMGIETGMSPIHEVKKGSPYTETVGGKESTYYDISLDTYYALGMNYFTLTEEQYLNIQAWQNESKIQVIYPAVVTSKLPVSKRTDANIWYMADQKGIPKLDSDGNFVDIYKTSGSDKYDSIRVSWDDGTLRYSNPAGTSAAPGYTVRINLYNYFIYKYGFEPCFAFGTGADGLDILTRLASGAQFSFLFAICISAINLVLGAIFGSIEGFFGGAIDLFMERVSDILSGVPFMVVTTLFQLHLAKHVGVVPSLLFAFVLTGWIGTASTVRMQFYRYKSQEYVMVARTLGAKNGRLMFRHIFPNAIGTIITSSVLVIPSTIFSESSLTYLGIVNLESSGMTSVGTMLANGRGFLSTDPHIILFPAIFISLLMITFNLFGNGLRDAFNPSLRGSED